jgi:hypothetical protein
LVVCTFAPFFFFFSLVGKGLRLLPHTWTAAGDSSMIQGGIHNAARQSEPIAAELEVAILNEAIDLNNREVPKAAATIGFAKK